MSNYLVDQVADIAARVKELRAEKDEALKGTSAPVTGQEQKTELPYGYGETLADYSAMKQLYQTIGQAQFKTVWGGPSYGNSNGGPSSLAHPNWPYAGTPHEWRGFINRGPSKDNNTVCVTVTHKGGAQAPHFED